MASSGYKAVRQYRIVPSQREFLRLPSGRAISKDPPSDAQAAISCQSVVPATTESADKSAMDTQPMEDEVDPNRPVAQTPVAETQQVSTQPPQAQICRETPSEKDLAAPNRAPEATTGATPPAQPGNAAADDSTMGQPLAAGVIMGPPSKPAQPALATALNSALTLESAVERIDGLLRRLALEHDSEGYFQEKVSPSVPGCESYYERIKSPVWFALIREKLRQRVYRTVNQVQGDVELLCQNAMIFNQKNSKVYKNAQGLLKGAKRQFSVEKSLLLEAMLVLHPNGPEAALKDEAEAQKLLKMAPPPKKPPPKKPSKPSKPGRTQRPSAKPSADAEDYKPPAALNFIVPTDVKVDLHDHSELYYSSFSDTDDEASASREENSGAPGSSLWGAEGLNQELPAVTAPTILTHVRSEEWRLQRQTAEWRIRWLEHRLTELSHQHKRYSAKLDSLSQTPDPPQAVEQAQDEAKPADAGPVQSEPVDPKQKRRRKRRTAAELSGPTLLADNPFMAAHCGLRFSSKDLKAPVDEELSEEDVNFPARVFAGAELMEQHLYGLRQQLCQDGSEIAYRRKPSGPRASSRSKQQKPKVRAAKRVRHTDDSAGFLVTGLGTSVPLHLPEKAKTIETPAFREITAEDRNDWVALRARQREHEQQRELRKEGKDVPMDGFESSSSEDTSDEKYYRLHSVEEAKEKAFDTADVGKANKKKRKLKTSHSHISDHEKLGSNVDTPASTVLIKTGSLKGSQAQKPDVTVLTNVQTTSNVSTPTPTLPGPLKVVTSVSVAESGPASGGTPRAGSTPRGGRGRGRGRGRPSNSSKAAMSAPSKRVAGPGRGHKTRGQKSNLGTPASAPPQLAQPPQPSVGPPDEASRQTASAKQAGSMRPPPPRQPA